MIMRLDYEFTYKNETFKGVGKDIGDTIDLGSEAKDIEGLKISAICDALNIDIDEFNEKYELKDFNFIECDLRI